MKSTNRMDEYHPPKVILPDVNCIPSWYLYQEKTKGLRRRYALQPNQKRRIEAAMKRITDIFAGEINTYQYTLHGIFVYNASECKGIYAESDGLACLYNDGGAIIGIDISAVERGGDYLAFLLLHELAHLAAGDAGHSPGFEGYLEYLILNYNTRYGANIKNDYSNYNDE